MPPKEKADQKSLDWFCPDNWFHTISINIDNVRPEACEKSTVGAFLHLRGKHLQLPVIGMKKK